MTIIGEISSNTCNAVARSHSDTPHEIVPKWRILFPVDLQAASEGARAISCNS